MELCIGRKRLAATTLAASRPFWRRLCFLRSLAFLAMVMNPALSRDTESVAIPVILSARKYLSHKYLAGGGTSFTPESYSLTITSPRDTLPAGIVKSRRSNFWLWKIPLVVAILSFGSFRHSSHLLYGLVEWSSQTRWLPSTDAQVNLQTNVVTQVVNGPVITSISVLFASLVSTTVTSLHERQVSIQQSLVQEVHLQRLLKILLSSSLATKCLISSQQSQALELVQKHSSVLLSMHYSSPSERAADPHLYIESSLMSLMQWCQSMREIENPQQHFRRRRPCTDATFANFIQEVESLTSSIMQERSNRWIALQAVHFPTAHYLTLSLLAISIVISFLVATAQAEVLFRDPGMYSIRILWSVLLTAFAALGVVCYDLSNPFGGAYTVAHSNIQKNIS